MKRSASFFIVGYAFSVALVFGFQSMAEAAARPGALPTNSPMVGAGMQTTPGQAITTTPMAGNMNTGQMAAMRAGRMADNTNAGRMAGQIGPGQMAGNVGAGRMAGNARVGANARSGRAGIQARANAAGRLGAADGRAAAGVDAARAGNVRLGAGNVRNGGGVALNNVRGLNDAGRAGLLGAENRPLTLGNRNAAGLRAGVAGGTGPLAIHGFDGVRGIRPGVRFGGVRGVRPEIAGPALRANRLNRAGDVGIGAGAGQANRLNRAGGLGLGVGAGQANRLGNQDVRANDVAGMQDNAPAAQKVGNLGDGMNEAKSLRNEGMKDQAFDANRNKIDLGADKAGKAGDAMNNGAMNADMNKLAELQANKMNQGAEGVKDQAFDANRNKIDLGADKAGKAGDAMNNGAMNADMNKLSELQANKMNQGAEGMKENAMNAGMDKIAGLGGNKAEKALDTGKNVDIEKVMDLEIQDNGGKGGNSSSSFRRPFFNDRPFFGNRFVDNRPFFNRPFFERPFFKERPFFGRPFFGERNFRGERFDD
ncbi:MAG: hypothetical protein AAGU11_17035 [Syntrophobacteraceae bacterium]